MTAKFKPIFRDPEIRSALCAMLESEHSSVPGTLLLEEFNCDGARADLALVNGSLHGFEIKAGHDSLSRLGNQIEGYGRIFDRVTLVVERCHTSKAREFIPDWWGLIEARERQGELVLLRKRAARTNRARDSHAMARMLWRKEAIALLKSHNAFTNMSSLPITSLWQAVGDRLPQKDIANALRLAIKARDGSGFRPPRFRSDDSYTI